MSLIDQARASRITTIFFTGVECPEPDLLAVEGHLPDWLAGTLLRNGPGLFVLPRQRMRHWFDGLALLHAVQFAGGRATYVSRFLRSRAYARALAAGRPASRGFATDPQWSVWERVVAAWTAEPSDNANVSVVALPIGPIAMTEVGLPHTIDPKTLEARGERMPWDGYKSARRLTSAHPVHLAGQGGAVLNVAVHLGRRSHYEIFRTAYAGGPPDVLARIPVDRPAYMHSFSATERFVVLVEYPFRVRPLDLALSGRPFVENYRWEPGAATRVLVIDRGEPGRPRIVETTAFFAFHHVAAFERGGQLCVDLIAYPDPSIIDRLYVAGHPAPGEPYGARLLRLEIDLTNGSVQTVDLGIGGIEFPWAVGTPGAEPSAVFACGRTGASPFPDMVVRIMPGKGVTAQWDGRGFWPGEPVFVPKPGGAGPDEGVVLTLALDANAQTSIVAVLRAADLSELARLRLPRPVPPGLHGCFVAEPHAQAAAL